MVVEKQTPVETSSKEPLQKQVHGTEMILGQSILDQPQSKTKGTIFEFEVPLPVSSEFSVFKDDKSLFPEIAPSTVVAKTIGQVEMVSK